MINVPNAIVPLGIAFSTDGAGIYAPSHGPPGISSKQVAEWSPVNDSLKAQIPISGHSDLADVLGSELALAPSIDPSSGDPVVFVPVSTQSNNGNDIGVQMVDTKTNMVTKTLAAGLNTSDNVSLCGAVATPNGKYVYVNYDDITTGAGYILVFDVVQGTATRAQHDRRSGE